MIVGTKAKLVVPLFLPPFLEFTYVNTVYRGEERTKIFSKGKEDLSFLRFFFFFFPP